MPVIALKSWSRLSTQGYEPHTSHRPRRRFLDDEPARKAAQASGPARARGRERRVTRWLVDGMNVVGSRPDGWWRAREGGKRGRAEKRAVFARETGEPVAVVFDGRPFEVDAAPVDVSFAE